MKFCRGSRWNIIIISAGFLNFIRWLHKGYRGLISQSLIKIKAYYSTSLIEVSVSNDFSFHAPIGPGHSQCVNCLSFFQTSSWCEAEGRAQKVLVQIYPLGKKARPSKPDSIIIIYQKSCNNIQYLLYHQSTNAQNSQFKVTSVIFFLIPERLS